MHESLEQIAARLVNGEVAAVPTETVYGLAASLSQPQAIENIFHLKKRPSNNPLIIHVASQEELKAFSPDVNQIPQFEEIVQAFWPGPLTLVVPIDINRVPEKVRAGLPTAAFRVPVHPLTRKLLALTGPLVMPSANMSGKPSATQPEHVEADFGRDFPVLDGGVCTQGVESTILIYQEPEWVIIRQGALSKEQFAPVLGYEPFYATSGDKPICPGQLYRHYAPKAKLLLTDTKVLSDCVIVGFSDRIYPSTCTVYVLGPSTEPETIAQNLYHTLRQLDQDKVQEACVDIDLPSQGLYRTILERLHKASQ